METTVHLPCSNVFRAYRNETLARNGSNHSPTLTLKKLLKLCPTNISLLLRSNQMNIKTVLKQLK